MLRDAGFSVDPTVLTEILSLPPWSDSRLRAAGLSFTVTLFVAPRAMSADLCLAALLPASRPLRMT